MLKLTSPSFAERGWISDNHAGFGKDESPEFHIEGIDHKTETMVITMDNLDHPIMLGYNHWIAWNIPPTSCISGGIPKGSTIENPIHVEQGIV